MAYKGPTQKGPYYKSFRVDNPELLLPCYQQKADVCWAIATIGQLDAALKLEKRLSYEEKLSVQELINLMPRGTLADGGAIKDIESIGDPLMNIGTVKDSDGPLLTYSVNDEPQVYGPEVERYRIKKLEVHYLDDYLSAYGENMGRKIFDFEMMKRLEKKPIAARVMKLDEKYNSIIGKDIYNLTEEEKREAMILDVGHIMLMSGHGRDDLGVDFREFQDSDGHEDSDGNEIGDNGYVRVAAGCDVITFFVDMKTLMAMK